MRGARAAAQQLVLDEEHCRRARQPRVGILDDKASLQALAMDRRQPPLKRRRVAACEAGSQNAASTRRQRTTPSRDAPCTHARTAESAAWSPLRPGKLSVTCIAQRTD
eukprot:6204632-Pleurochrysis_carterae.AAC.2